MNDEMKDLVNGKNLLIAIFRYKSNDYELIGHLKMVKNNGILRKA